MFSLRSYLASVFAVLVISSCASRPELVPVLKPELGQMSAEVELNGVLLMAEIDSDTAGDVCSGRISMAIGQKSQISLSEVWLWRPVCYSHIVGWLFL